MTKNDKGQVKHATEYVSTLKNGWKLEVDFGEVEVDGSFVRYEYWIKEQDLKRFHNYLLTVIDNFGLPRKGECICDDSGIYTVYEVWYTALARTIYIAFID